MRTLLALAGLSAGLIGLAIDAWEIFPSVMVQSATNPIARGFPDAFISFWTYFTHLTNLGLVLVYLAGLTGWRGLAWFDKPHTRALMAGYILLVALYYHFMLAPFYTFEGPLLVATIILHYVTPIYYLAWWALFTPHGSLRFADIPGMLLPGVIYVAWAVGRGGLTGEYPYDILDAGKNGYSSVALGVAVLIIAVAGLCSIVVGLDRALDRHRPRTAP